MIKRFFKYLFPSSEIREEAKAQHAFTADEQRLIEVCSSPVEKSFEIMLSSMQGLDDDEVDTRQKKYGLNETPRAKQLNFFQDLAQRFKSPLVVQLLVIAIVSGFMGDISSGLIVSAMIVLSVGLSYLMDSRSSRAVEALGKRVQSRSVVIREGKEIELPIVELVPGDIVLLQAGSIIPADLRLLMARDFFVNQAALTGESMPVEKNAEPCSINGRSVHELGNACFLGGSVDSGSARGLVVNTGSHSFFGAIAERLAKREEETSFDKGLRSFTWLMIRFMLVMTFSVFMIVGITKGNWLEALLFGLSIAVGLTPEMLPMIVTFNLAKGALSMSKKKVIIKRLSSIQNFGAIDILCTDKTGTLTQDRVVLLRYMDARGKEDIRVFKYAYLNSYYQTGLKNLLDVAVLGHDDVPALNHTEERHRKVDEIPFDFHRRRMSVVLEQAEGKNIIITKGAVEEILRVCSSVEDNGAIVPLTGEHRAEILRVSEDLNDEGLMVLGVATRLLPREDRTYTVADEQDMVLSGYIGFLDPPKETAGPAIAALKNHGIAIKVLTGDNALVTQKVCEHVGIDPEPIVRGDEIEAMTD
ncbi:MAG TPA: magnesium-translocating P-type ATPase, partial [Desulfomonilia bacterium]|nr:magnesium-translocating P-type ATPase [Desulfomonilia bacterium]